MNEHTLKFGKFIYQWNYGVRVDNEFGISFSGSRDEYTMDYYIGLGFLESTHPNKYYHDFRVTALGKEILKDYEIYHNL